MFHKEILSKERLLVIWQVIDVPRIDYPKAILIWEVIHSGETPYGTMDPVVVAHEVLNGNTLKFLGIPEKSKCPTLHKLMTSCLKEEPTKRPSFKDMNVHMLPKLTEEEIKNAKVERGTLRKL